MCNYIVQHLASGDCKAAMIHDFIGQGLSFHAFRSLSLTPRGARPLP